MVANPQFMVGSHLGEPAIFLSAEDEERLVAPLRKFLIAKFVRNSPPIESIRKHFETGNFKDKVQIGRLGKRAFLIRCASQDDFNRLRIKGTWFIEGYRVRVSIYSPENWQKNETTTAPIWFDLPNLPIQYFNRDFLFSIASQIGDPIALDNATKSMTRPTCARICVDVNLLNPLVKRIWIQGSQGGFWQPLLAGKLPLFCSSCCKMGHSVANCRKNRELSLVMVQQKRNCASSLVNESSNLMPGMLEKSNEMAHHSKINEISEKEDVFSSSLAEAEVDSSSSSIMQSTLIEPESSFSKRMEGTMTKTGEPPVSDVLMVVQSREVIIYKKTPIAQGADDQTEEKLPVNPVLSANGYSNSSQFQASHKNLDSVESICPPTVEPITSVCSLSSAPTLESDVAICVSSVPPISMYGSGTSITTVCHFKNPNRKRSQKKSELNWRHKKRIRKRDKPTWSCGSISLAAKDVLTKQFFQLPKLKPKTFQKMIAIANQYSP